ncbi:MAG: PIN domain-containing protein [Gemmatimonadota bacterium]|nr:PIN domain-containing protein [Gemmatimonadota bacterium]
MAREVFVDTSGWFPIMIKGHADHKDLAGALTKAVTEGFAIVTTNLVVAETHALLMRRDNRQAALDFVNTVGEIPNIVVRSTEELEQDAYHNWLVPFEDQDFSFTDAVSFAVMEERGIETAIALDRHFSVAGFSLLA